MYVKLLTAINHGNIKYEYTIFCICDLLVFVTYYAVLCFHTMGI